MPAAVAMLAAVLPNVRTQRIAGAGHVPAASHPEQLATIIAAFAIAADTPATAGEG